MGLELLDVDVTRPLEELYVSPNADGIALLLRDGRRPLGFLLLEQTTRTLPRAALEELAVDAGAAGLVQERLRLALLGKLPPRAAVTAPVDQLVTVAVCTRNRPGDLSRCLQAIERAVKAYGRPVDVLVVDNAPPDDATRDAVQHHPDVRYVREPVAGLDVARNRALAEARGTWLAFVDDDVRVDEFWLDGLAAAREEHPDAAAVVGLVLPAELETEAQIRFERKGGFGRGFTQLRWDGRFGGGHLHPLGAGAFGAGADMAFDVAVVRKLGGFDEALDTGPPLPGGGDLDIFFRVLAAGFPLVYEPRMAVFHRHRRGMDELTRQYYSWGTGFAAYLGARWTDPGERKLILRLVAWWLRYQRGQVTSALRRGDKAELRMAFAEARGGFTGALGGYQRSQRRMARRRAAVLHEAPG